MVSRKLKWCPVPGIRPVLFKSKVDSPATDVPRAVLTIAAATITPSPGFEILP